METWKTYAVTGTFHGSIVVACTEGEARNSFHNAWNGESIICMKVLHGKWLQKPDFEQVRDLRKQAFYRTMALESVKYLDSLDEEDLPF